jgi:hypothetical protein
MPMNDKEFDRFLLTSVKELNKKQDNLIRQRGMGSFDNFEVDLAVDELLFFRDGKAVLRAKIMIVGTHVEEQEDWLWGWANSGLPPEIRKRSEKLKELAKLTGEKNLAAPNLSVDGESAWELLAMSCKHLGALGAYTFPNRDARIYVLILELEQLSGKKTKRAAKTAPTKRAKTSAAKKPVAKRRVAKKRAAKASPKKSKKRAATKPPPKKTKKRIAKKAAKKAKRRSR